MCVYSGRRMLARTRRVGFDVVQSNVLPCPSIQSPGLLHPQRGCFKPRFGAGVIKKSALCHVLGMQTRRCRDAHVPHEGLQARLGAFGIRGFENHALRILEPHRVRNWRQRIERKHSAQKKPDAKGKKLEFH
jgi:hypothetical protein